MEGKKICKRAGAKILQGLKPFFRNLQKNGLFQPDTTKQQGSIFSSSCTTNSIKRINTLPGANSSLFSPYLHTYLFLTGLSSKS